jgi:lactoylglutathione lyase
LGPGWDQTYASGASPLGNLAALAREKRPVCSAFRKWRGPESNRRHHDFQSCALPTELPRRGADGSGANVTAISELIHTCYRIGDIDRSVAFYEALGFEEVGRLPIRDEAINVFMGLPGDGPRLELTYNHGVDSYELGTGYNHVAITAEDLDGTLAKLADQGIEPEKPPYTVSDGGSRLCFVRDPDGYRIELIERNPA